MLSRPFKINDTLYFQEKHVIVEDIDLIYTRMRTMDNIVISVPNQTLLDTVIENQSIYDSIRQNVLVTADYKESPERIVSLLLEAVTSVGEILVDPSPYVWITDFGNFALEYTVYYHIASIENVVEIDSKIKESILRVFNMNKIDLSTPSLVHSVK